MLESRVNDLVEENKLLKLHLLPTEDTTNANNQQPPYHYGSDQCPPQPPGAHYQGMYPPPPRPHHHNMPPPYDAHQSQWIPLTYMAHYARHHYNMDSTREILQSTISILALQTSAMMTSMFNPSLRLSPQSRPYYRRPYNQHYGGQSVQQYSHEKCSIQNFHQRHATTNFTKYNLALCSKILTFDKIPMFKFSLATQ